MARAWSSLALAPRRVCCNFTSGDSVGLLKSLLDGADSLLGPGSGLLLVAGGVRAGLGGGPLFPCTAERTAPVPLPGAGQPKEPQEHAHGGEHVGGGRPAGRPARPCDPHRRGRRLRTAKIIMSEPRVPSMTD